MGLRGEETRLADTIRRQSSIGWVRCKSGSGRAIYSVVRAHGLQPWGRGFESSIAPPNWTCYA